LNDPIVAPQVGQPVIDRPRLGERIARVVHQVRHPALDAKLPAELLGRLIIVTGDDDEVIEVPEVVGQRLGQKIRIIHANSNRFQSTNGYVRSPSKTN
jgi:hypothetical protein